MTNEHDEERQLTPMERLSEPIPAQYILKLPPRGEPYITATTAEWWLDRAVGKDGWGWSYTVVEATPDRISVECTITIDGIAKTDVGQSLYRPPGQNSPEEPPDFKQAYSDAFKRAARRWGVARHLAFK